MCAMLWAHIQRFSFNSHNKCDYWRSIFSPDYFGELPNDSETTPRIPIPKLKSLHGFVYIYGQINQICCGVHLILQTPGKQ